MPSIKDNAKIVAAAKADPDAKPMTKAQLEALVPIRAVRGRPKSENKKLLLSVRYSAEVVKYFRATGEGWQARMDNVLRQYVNKHVPRSEEHTSELQSRQYLVCRLLLEKTTSTRFRSTSSSSRRWWWTCGATFTRSCSAFFFDFTGPIPHLPSSPARRFSA